MAEKTVRKKNKPDEVELALRSDELQAVSSGSVVRKPSPEVEASDFSDLPATELTGIAAKLASVELPVLERENRSRLLMQTPNRLFFYWSVKSNPFQTVDRAVADGAKGYQLVVRLLDLTHDTEEIHSVEPSGSWWFDVDADCEYRGEIGLFAPNRPYVRILYSNTVMTPRRSPSPVTATDSDWMVTADSFAEVLSVSGFKQDAFEVALRGEDESAANAATQSAFEDLFGPDAADAAGENYSELRSALLHLSLGLPLESLKWRISATLYRILQQYFSNVGAERIQAALKQRFGVEVDDVYQEEALSPVHGSSLVSFPTILRRRRKILSDYKPVSSFRE